MHKMEPVAPQDIYEQCQITAMAYAKWVFIIALP